MKTSELTGAALDWAVAIAEGFDPETLNTKTSVVYSLRYGVYAPSTNWAQGGPIIERERITLRFWEGESVVDAYKWDTPSSTGPTPLIAAMRCYVASKLGDDIDVPSELM